MDIANASMTSLLKEALTPAAGAVVGQTRPGERRALIQPPAPATVQSAQFAAQALNGSLAKPPAPSPQRLSCADVENAYRPVMEPDAGADSAAPRTPAGGQAADADQPSRAVPQVQPPAADGTANVLAPPPPSSFSPVLASGVLIAANANTPRPRGTAGPGRRVMPRGPNPARRRSG